MIGTNNFAVAFINFYAMASNVACVMSCTGKRNTTGSLATPKSPSSRKVKSHNGNYPAGLEASLQNGCCMDSKDSSVCNVSPTDINGCVSTAICCDVNTRNDCSISHSDGHTHDGLHESKACENGDKPPEDTDNNSHDVNTPTSGAANNRRTRSDEAATGNDCNNRKLEHFLLVGTCTRICNVPVHVFIVIGTCTVHQVLVHVHTRVHVLMYSNCPSTMDTCTRHDHN